MPHAPARNLELPARSIALKTRGHAHGGLARLASPGDLGERMKPFVFLDFFEIDPAGFPGFGYHPHSGIATVTFTVSGDNFYEETNGQTGTLHAGDVEWMTAGGGVWHRGGPAGKAIVKGFQLWIALPADRELEAPLSQYLRKEAIPSVGPARILLGRYGTAVSPIESPAPINYLAVDLKAGENWVFDTPQGHDVAWIAVHQGTVRANGKAVEKGELALFEESGEPISFDADTAAGFVLGSAAKHPHPLVTGYYSVHTSAAALRTGEANIALLGEELKAKGLM